MEFWNKNEINTSTMISVNTGTLTTESILTRDPRRQWLSDGFNNDATTASFTITFSETTTISRIALDGINFKQFRIFYNGATASTFTLTTTAATTTSNFSTNSETAMVLTCTPVGVTSVTIDIYSTQTANAEKAMGWYCLSSQLLDFEKVPDSKSYDPNITVEQKEHKLSDGGTRIHTIERKFAANIKLKYIARSFRDDLYDIWRDANDFIFVDLPTTSSWNKTAYEVVWPGKFDFLEFSDNNIDAGFSGSITLKEISR